MAVCHMQGYICLVCIASQEAEELPEAAMKAYQHHSLGQGRSWSPFLTPHTVLEESFGLAQKDH